MLNLNKIQKMNDKELAVFLKDFRSLCKYPEYADIEKWLGSDSTEMVYKGKKTKFQGRPALIVDTKLIFGKPYDVIIQDGEMVKVPRI